MAPISCLYFGLLHGLGFATLLTQYGLPKDNFISLLLAFNVGVEFGQFAVLLAAFILIRLIYLKTEYKNQLKIRINFNRLYRSFWFIESII